MILSEGYFYHIKDDYFSTVNEETLMSNHENSEKMQPLIKNANT